MADKKNTTDPSVRDSASLRMAPRYELMRMMMGGTEALREAGEDYLPRHEAESDKNYERRLHRSFMTNYFAKTVATLSSKPFRKPVSLPDFPQALIDLTDDIDCCGTDLNTFAQESFSCGLVYGITHILVDYPDMAGNQVQTKADEDQIGARPYFVHIHPENILAAFSENRQGTEYLTHVRIWEEIRERQPGSFDEVIINQVRVLEPGIWQIWRKVSNKDEWGIYQQGTTSLSYIPLITYYAKREGLMLGALPLQDLAYMNLSHWIGLSDQSNALTVARFPILAGSGIDQEEAARVEVGPRSFLTSRSENGKYYYVEHSGAAINVGRQSLEDIKSEMAALGSELLQRPGNITATERAIDSSEDLCELQKLAIKFSEFLRSAFRVAADWMNIDMTGNVQLYMDFSLNRGNQQELATLDSAQSRGVISRTAYLKELMRRDILDARYNPDEDAEQIEIEKDQVTVAATARALIAAPVVEDPESQQEDAPEQVD